MPNMAWKLRGAPRWSPVVVAAGLAAFVGLGAGLMLGRIGPATFPAASAATAPPPAGATALQNAFVGALRAAAPSVVEISTTEGLGSGVIFDTKGDVVTNAHVVGTATSFTVLLTSGKSVSASLVGTFTADDLAVIRMSNTTGIRPATFADSSKLAVGEITLAIGSPYGLAGSVTDGIVSSTGRAVSESNGVLLPNTIQTSAAINPGNSGGALVDLSGAVIGIPTLAATDQAGTEAAGIGFAIPSNTVKLIAPQLIAHGKVTSAGRAALGITGQDVASYANGPLGLYVISVLPGGPAAKAGIVAGDVVTALAGQQVHSFTELQSVLAGLKPGAKVSVTVIRAGGAKSTLSITLGDLASM